MLKKIKLRHIGIASGFVFLAIWWVSLSTQREVKKIIQNAPLPAAHTPELRLPEVPAVDPVQESELEEIQSALDDLAENDSRVESLMARAEEIITREPTLAHSWFKTFIPKISKVPTEHSLFFVKAFLQKSPDPVARLQEVLTVEATPMQRRQTHSNFSPEQKINLVKVYALEQMAARMEEEPQHAETLREFLPTLIEMAKREPDLALAREAAQRVRQVHPQAEKALREIIGSRTRAERFAFEDLT